MDYHAVKNQSNIVDVYKKFDLKIGYLLSSVYLTLPSWTQLNFLARDPHMHD